MKGDGYIMEHTLIRFTSSKYIKSYLKGDLWLSSLNDYWNIFKGKISHERYEAGEVSQEEIRQAIAYAKSRQQDFSEGAAMQVKKDIMKGLAGDDFAKNIIHDVRFRIHAYSYVNLLCFYRVDCLEHVVQLPPSDMDTFGDAVVVIKDEAAFVDRVIEAVRKQGGDVIAGNIVYHEMKDRLEPAAIGRHHFSFVLRAKDGNTAIFNVKEVLKDRDDIIHLGCLDKYTPYSFQKEWRVCWLPKEYNTEAETLHCGSLDDIIDIIPTKDIRSYLLKKYRGSIPGEIINPSIARGVKGTMSYKQFMRRIEDIDGMSTVLCEIG